MGCIFLTQQIKDLAKENKDLGGEEVVKNLISLWQEENNKTINEIPTIEELRSFKEEVRSSVIQGLTIDSDTEADLTKETKQETFDAVKNWFYDMINSNPELKEKLFIQGGDVVLNSFSDLKDTENAKLFQAACYQAMIKYNQDTIEIEEEEGPSEETRRFPGMINTLFLGNNISKEEKETIESQFSRKEVKERIEGLTTLVQERIDGTLKKEIIRLGKEISKNRLKGNIEIANAYQKKLEGLNNEKIINLYLGEILNNIKVGLNTSIGTQTKNIMFDNTLSKQEKEERIKRYKIDINKITNNYGFLSKRVIQRIEEINGIKLNINNEITEKDLNFDAEGTFSDMDINTKSASSTVGKDVKRVVSTIYKKDKNGNKILDSLGMPRFLDAGEVLGCLYQLCQNMDDSKGSIQMIDIFSKNSDRYPFLNDIMERMGDEERLEGTCSIRSQFFSVLRRDPQTYLVLNHKRLLFKSAKNSDTNTVKSWKGNFVNGTILNNDYSIYDENGVMNTKMFSTNFEKLVSSLEKFGQGTDLRNTSLNIDFFSILSKIERSDHDSKSYLSLIKTITGCMQGLGIEITEEDVQNSIKDSFKEKKEENLLSLLFQIYQIESLSSKDIYDNCKGYEEVQKQINPIRLKRNGYLYEKRDKQFQLLSESLKISSNISSEKMIRAGGKSYTSFCLPSKASTIVKKIQNFKGTKDEFSDFIGNMFKNAEWYFTLKKDGSKTWRNGILKNLISSCNKSGMKYRKLFDISKLLTVDNKNYADFSSADFLSLCVQCYKNDGGKSSLLHKAGWRTYVGPILGDRDYTITFSAPKYKMNDFLTQDKIIATAEEKGTTNVEDALWDLFNQEMKRIDLCRKRAENEAIVNISSFDVNGQHFCFLKGLNNIPGFIDAFYEDVKKCKEKTGKEYTTAFLELKSRVLTQIRDYVINPLIEENFNYFLNENLLNVTDKTGNNVFECDNLENSYQDIYGSLEQIGNDIIDSYFKNFKDLFSEDNISILKDLLSEDDFNSLIGEKEKLDIEDENVESFSLINDILENKINKNKLKEEKYKSLEKILKNIEEVHTKENKINEFEETDEFKNYCDKLTNTSFISIKEHKNINDKMKDILGINIISPSRYQNISDISDFTVNNALALSNYIQLTSIDLAFYSSHADFQKRNYQAVAQTQKVDVDAIYDKKKVCEDGTMKAIVLADKIQKSPLYAAAENVFKNMPDSFYKHIILKSYKENNGTDGQAIRTLPSFKKLHIMSGIKWTTEMENSYQKLLSGDFDPFDMNVIFQITKPLLFATIEQDSELLNGDKTHTSFLRPIQLKDSECPLYTVLSLIAKAQSEKTGKEDLLSSLNDFMQENGVDLVVFNSAVKVGVSGMIDLNNKGDKTYKQILEETALVNEEKGKLNPNTSLTLPWSDWGIISPTPVKFTDKKIPMGTQVKRIIASNLDPNDTVIIPGEGERTIGDVKKEYFSLFAVGIAKQAKKLKEMFSSDASLYKVLVDNWDDGKNLETDIYENTLDAMGQFEIPLCEVSESFKSENKLCAIEKQRLTKTKIRGAQAIQESSFGVSEDLSIVLKDANGVEITKNTYKEAHPNVTQEEIDAWFTKEIAKDGVVIDRMECYLPVYSETLKKYLKKYPNGILDLNELPKELREVIGYRSPTEAKYSINRLYIKGFLPASTGEPIILPSEITLLSGSDYDVDKLFLLFNEFRETNKLSDNFFENKENEALGSYLNSLNESKKEPISLQISAFFNQEAERNNKVSELTKNDLIYHIKTFEFSKDEDINKDIQDILIKQVEEHKRDFFKDVIIYDKYDFENPERNSQNQVNNRILQLANVLLSTKDSSKQMLTPGNFETHKNAAFLSNALHLSSDVLDELFKKNDIKPETFENGEIDYVKTILNYYKKNNNVNFVRKYMNATENSISAATQLNTQQRNMIGKKLLASAAVSNTCMLDLQQSELEIGEKYTIELFGHKFSNLHSPYILDDNNPNKKQMLKSDYQSGYLSAAADNGKIAVLLDMGIDLKDVQIALFMGVCGYTPIEVMTFLQQPIISDVRKQMSSGATESLQTAINRTAYQYKLKILEIRNESREKNNLPALQMSELTNELKETIDEHEIDTSIEVMMENIFYRKENEEDENALKDQLILLSYFEKESAVAKSYGTVTAITRGDSKTSGTVTNIAKTLKNKTKLNKFLKLNGSCGLINLESVYSPSENPGNIVESVKKAPMPLTTLYEETALNYALNLLAKQFPEARPKFIHLLEELEKAMGDKVITEEEITKFYNAYIYYCLSSLDFYGAEKDAEGNEIISAENKRAEYIKYFPNYFIEMCTKYKSILKDNKFIDMIDFIPSKYSKNTYIGIKVDGSFDKNDIEVFQDGWEKLINSENEDLRQLGTHLIRYLFYTTGNGFAASGFSYCLSDTIKKKIPGYLDVFRGEIDNIYVSPETLIDQFIQNNSRDSNLVQYAKEKDISTQGLDDNLVDDGYVHYTLYDAKTDNNKYNKFLGLKEETNASRNNFKKVIRNSAEAIKEPKSGLPRNIPSYIKVGNVIYKNIKVTNGEKSYPSAYFKELSPLGDSYLMKEYVYEKNNLKTTTEYLTEEERQKLKLPKEEIEENEEEENEINDDTEDESMDTSNDVIMPGTNEEIAEDDEESDLSVSDLKDIVVGVREDRELEQLPSEEGDVIGNFQGTKALFDSYNVQLEKIGKIVEEVSQEESMENKNLSNIVEPEDVVSDEGLVLCKL